MLAWSVRRRITYLSIVLGFFALIGVFLVVRAWPQPTCFDGKMNQDELGVDCGGSCAIACTAQIAPMKPLWTRVLEVRKGQYDVVSLVENPNDGYGYPSARYEIQVADGENVLIAERRGETYVNPGERFVVFEPGIDTGERKAARAFITLEQIMPWQKVETEKPLIAVSYDRFVSEPQPKLFATVRNTTVGELKDIKVAAVLSDRERNAYAASATVIDELGGGESREVVFTWPGVLARPAYVDLYPSVDVFELE